MKTVGPGCGIDQQRANGDDDDKKNPADNPEHFGPSQKA
jgi:hypothetical protein